MLLLLAAAAALPWSAPAAAVPHDSVRLPMIPLTLTGRAGCTGSSGTTFKEVPWEQQNLGLADAWRFANGEGVTVAVVDTGVSEAPALAGRVSAVGDAGRDCVGHGTFVAGLIAARVDAEVRFAGVAPKARILAVRGTDKLGVASAGSVANGIRAAADRKADVIVVSAALPQMSSNLTSAVSTALEGGAVVVAAAAPDPSGTGADPSSAPQEYWPAAQPGVLSVLGVGGDGTLPDGALTPRHADLTAPGESVLGIGPRGSGHFVGSGSSLAAAFTAGAAALVLSANPSLTAPEVTKVLISTAYPDGVPRLDPYAAVTVIRDSAAPSPSSVGAPVRMPTTDPVVARATRRAILMFAAGVGVVLLVSWCAAAIPGGRSRR
ncbi:S8 family serine peptidase [Streptomyces sp. NPDC020681]|uniref:S8 family serine peptidase n=1 Tax=Streptomyces sp. NPDC020681 TaxID=3365083 RepID=UPI0037B8F17A